MEKEKRNALAKRTKRKALDHTASNNNPLGYLFLSLRDACLRKKVSLFQSAIANIPTKDVYVMTILLEFKQGKYREPIERLRAETDKKKRDELKMQLPAVTIQSEPCSKRGKTYCKNNGLVCLDIDDVDDPEEAKRKFISLPYVLAVFISASGKGVFAICVLVEPAEDLKPIMEAMQKDFEYPIDEKCSDVSRLRFVTYDPEPAVRKDITPFILPIKANKVPRQTDIVHDTEHRIDRARAYIAAMPPAISGKCGHDAALNVANKLYEFGLTKNEAFSVFKEDYNPRCQPEWSDNEIQHKISEAFSKPLNAYGSKLWESTSEKPRRKKETTRKLEHPDTESEIELDCWENVEDREPEWFINNSTVSSNLDLT